MDYTTTLETLNTETEEIAATAAIPKRRIKLANPKQKQLNFYLPENLPDLATLLPPHLVNEAALLIHIIVMRTRKTQKLWNGYAPLKKKYLDQVIGWRKLGPVVKVLIAQNIIECDGQYIIGVKSFGYKLDLKYQYSKIKRRVITDRKFVSRFERNRTDGRKELLTLDIHKHLSNKLMDIEFDYPVAEKLILASGADQNKIEKRLLNCSQLRDRDFWLKPCRYMRVHTNLTNLSKLGRSCLSHQRQELFEIDICNSQPMLLSVLFFLHANSLNYKQLLKDFLSSIFSLSNLNNQTTLLHPSLPTANLRSPISCKLDIFKDLCEQGKLYEFLQKEYQDETGKMLSIKKVKELVFFVLYSKNKSYGKTQRERTFKKLFKAIFPELFDFCKKIKRKNHRVLAREMQRLEADIVIHHVARAIMLLDPNIPLYTIHDSILTTQPYVQLVQDLLTQAFKLLEANVQLRTQSVKDHIPEALRSVLQQDIPKLDQEPKETPGRSPEPPTA